MSILVTPNLFNKLNVYKYTDHLPSPILVLSPGGPIRHTRRHGWKENFVKGPVTESDSTGPGR